MVLLLVVYQLGRYFQLGDLQGITHGLNVDSSSGMLPGWYPFRQLLDEGCEGNK